MSAKLLEIHPREVKFIFEAKKQSSCSVQLTNVSDQYVAFKVKTTSPKKYCVKPNAGIVKPKSIFDFTVIMQAQQSAPPGMECKDKFLVQSTVVHFGTTEDDITLEMSTVIHFGTTEDDITLEMFIKGSDKYVEENKLRVVLTSSSPCNSRVLEQEPSYETATKADKLEKGNENPAPSYMLTECAKEKKLKLTNEIKEMKSKAEELEHQIYKAKSTISDLACEIRIISEAKKTMKQELARRRNGACGIQKRFSLSFVCMAAFISLTVGYLLHP